MKVFALVAVLLVAGLSPKAEANVFQDIGDFFTNFLNSFGQTAVQALANTGEQLLRNVTATTADLLSQTGQLALFQLGNTLNTDAPARKRALSDDLLQLVAATGQFEEVMRQALGETATDVQKLLTAGETVVNRLVTGQTDPQTVLDFVPQLRLAAQHVTDDLASKLFGELTRLMSGPSSKRQANLLSGLMAQVNSFLQPLVTLVHQEVGAVANAVETLAHNVLNNDNAEIVLSGLLSNLHL